jgi:hypothetical protein
MADSQHRPSVDDAWWISRLHEFWLTRYVAKGWYTPLQAEHLPSCPKSLRAEPVLFSEAQANWERELQTGREGGPSLVRGVWWPAAKREFVGAIVYGAVSGITNTVLRPLFLRWTLLVMDPSNGHSVATGYAYAAGLVLAMWLEGWTKHRSIQLGGNAAPAKFASATMHLLGRKAVFVGTGEGTAGAETALVGNDVVRSVNLVLFLPVLVQVWQPEPPTHPVARHTPRDPRPDSSHPQLTRAAATPHPSPLTAHRSPCPLLAQPHHPCALLLRSRASLRSLAASSSSSPLT